MEEGIRTFAALGMEKTVKSLQAELRALIGTAKPTKEAPANGFKAEAGPRYGLKGDDKFHWDCVRGGNVPNRIREAKAEDIIDRGPIPKDEPKDGHTKAA